MSDNKDLKNKILLMRQKSFGEVTNESDEKNDNEKPESDELKYNETNTELNKDKDEETKQLLLTYLKYKELEQSCTTFGVQFFKFIIFYKI